MDAITLENDHGRDVRFTGEEIASASSHHYEGPSNTRWTELTLYRTDSGRLICGEVGLTCWQGESDRHTVHVCADEAALIESVGTGWLAKELYDEAGIDHAEDID